MTSSIPMKQIDYVVLRALKHCPDKTSMYHLGQRLGFRATKTEMGKLISPALKRLEEAGLVEACGAKEWSNKRYMITKKGLEFLEKR